MFSSVLMVCVGNICRSPTAEYLLKKKAEERGSNLKVSSAGVSALVGKGAAPKACELASELGISMDEHSARQLTAELVHQHDLVLVMEEGHVKAVEALVPTARGKVHLLGRWNQGVEIPDPWRQGDEAYVHALGLIQQSVDAWAEKLCR